MYRRRSLWRASSSVYRCNLSCFVNVPRRWKDKSSHRSQIPRLSAMSTRLHASSPTKSIVPIVVQLETCTASPWTIARASISFRSGVGASYLDPWVSSLELQVVNRTDSQPRIGCGGRSFYGRLCAPFGWNSSDYFQNTGGKAFRSRLEILETF